MQKRFLFILLSSTMLLFQNCKKDNHTDVTPHTEDAHWNYEHPESWGGSSTDCDGVIQSPIDILTALTLKSNLPDLIFSYKNFPINIVDNGHTIQVNTKDYYIDNTVTYNSKTYMLKQFHFHAHSEHTIDGKSAPMEMHLVHANASGEILVVGLMIEEGLTANTLIDKVWLNFPGDTEKEHETTSIININDVIPAAKGYYNYIGSLTTPPCSMGLQWIVMKETLKLSATQINQFRAKYDHNYRPVQKLNNRVVYEKI